MTLLVPGYVVEHSVGRGRTGEVFRALRNADAVTVAVRKIAPELASQPGIAAALMGLKGECAVLRSPSVVPIAAVVESDGAIFVVEPWIDGVTLADELARKPTPPEDVHALAMDLMDAVADLHRQRVVHGDIRPSNVLLTSYGARLVGVGVAHRTQRRKGGGFLLRDPYDAPEMDDGVASHLTDVYAVGAVLMHAVTGEEGPYDFLSETDAVTDELLKAMSPAPEHRHGNVEALRMAFTDAEKRRGPVKKRAEPPPPPSWMNEPAAAAVPWPEEDEVNTRDSMPAVGDPSPAPPTVRPRPAKAVAVSARKEGTVAPGEQFEELLDRTRKWLPLAGAVAGGLLLLIGVIAVVPDTPEDMLLVAPPIATFGDPAGQADERPGFQATIPPFWLDRVEVTAADYAACQEAGKCTPTALATPAAPLPMAGLTWLQAQGYCTWRDKRLPTENEWEAAARGAGRYPWGDGEPDCGRARYGVLPGGPCATEDGLAGAAPGPDITTLPEETFAHLAGNVWEFVDADHRPERGPGSGGATRAGQSTLRVIKGGAWSSGAADLRPAARIGVRTDYAAADVGFRCARDDG